MTRTELLTESGLDNNQLRELESFGLVQPGSSGYYDADTALLATTIGELVEAGMEPRHLRPFRTAADREAALVSQLVSAQAKQKNPDARERAEQQAAQLASTPDAVARAAGEGRYPPRTRRLIAPPERPPTRQPDAGVDDCVALALSRRADRDDRNAHRGCPDRDAQSTADPDPFRARRATAVCRS